jgi:hypothetical protein
MLKFVVPSQRASEPRSKTYTGWTKTGQKARERAAGYLRQPHRRRARAEAGQQQVKVGALGDGPVDALARGHEGHLEPPETEGPVT